MPVEATSSSDVRISTLVGDRLCIKCGYNLVGQPILRESHYDMLIVRCPECATVASVQEYPLLGRWANRWAALLAGLWMLFLVVLWFGSAGALFGFAVGSAEVASETYGDRIYERYSAWQTQQQTAAAAATGQLPPVAPSAVGGPPGGPVGPGGQLVVRINPGDFSAWWKQQDTAAFLRDAGGLFSGVNWITWYLWMWMTIVALVFGVMWATLLLGRGRGGLIAWAGVIALTAATIGMIPMMDWLGREPTWTRQAAARQIAPFMLGASLAWAFAAMSVGMCFGRSIARGMVTMMLPPRMRSALSFLWLTDGLEPPKSNHRPVARTVPN